MSESRKPQIFVIGGPNGSGKTTLSHRVIAETGLPYIGADAIAKRINPEDVDAAHVAAGREFLRVIANQIEVGEGFVVESTLSGRSLSRTVQKAKDAGFEIIMYMIFLQSADQSITRVADRVRRGGHHVPPEDVRRRFARALSNFWLLYRPLADQWDLLRNDSTERILVAGYHGGSLDVADPPSLERFFELAGIDDESSSSYH